MLSYQEAPRLVRNEVPAQGGIARGQCFVKQPHMSASPLQNIRIPILILTNSSPCVLHFHFHRQWNRIPLRQCQLHSLYTTDTPFSTKTTIHSFIYSFNHRNNFLYPFFNNYHYENALVHNNPRS